MITLNYDKMMVKKCLNSTHNLIAFKRLEKGNMWSNIFPTSVVFKWGGNQSLYNGSCIYMQNNHGWQ